MMQTIWTRDYSLHRMEQAARSLIGGRAQRWLGLSVTKTISIGAADGFAAFQVDAATWKKALGALRSILEHPRRFTQYHREYREARRHFLATAKRVGRGAVRTEDTERLAAFLETFNDEHDRFMLTGQWIPYYLAELSERMVQDLALLSLKDANQRQAAVKAVFTLDRMTAIRQERVDLLSIAQLRSANERDRQIERHTLRYQWLPCINYFGSQPWTRAYFYRAVAEVRQSGNAAAERRDVVRTFGRNRRAFHDSLEEFPREAWPAIRQAHQLIFLKDDRDDARRRSYFLARPLYGRIARVLGLSTTLVEYLTLDEMLRALRKGDRITPLMLIRRKRGYLMQIVRGEARVTLRPRTHLDVVIEQKVLNQTLSGVVACGGRAVGLVRIARLPKDVRRVRPGDILVAVSTHPEFLPAMRRAAAFVTDEGGLTSHAAIVARELNKPCIVGTKHATHVLKDGDRVEVDATKGIIRKL